MHKQLLINKKSAKWITIEAEERRGTLNNYNVKNFSKFFKFKAN